MEKIVLVCNKCGKEEPGIQTLYIKSNETYTDPVDLRTDYVTKRVDLCPICLRAELLRLIFKYNHTDCNLYFEWYRDFCDRLKIKPTDLRQ